MDPSELQQRLVVVGSPVELPSSTPVRASRNRSMAKIKPKALLAQSKVKKGPSQISVTTIFTYLVLGVVVVSSVYAAYKYWLGKGPEVAAVGAKGN